MTPYPAFGDDPARWGLLPEVPMSEAEAEAAEQREAWGRVAARTVTCRHCRREGVRNADIIPVPVPGMRFEYECADYRECADYSRPERPAMGES